MKKKILAILLCFFAFALCGCSQPVEYSLYQDTENRVVEMNYIPFSCSELRLVGVGEDVILQMQSRIIERVYSYYASQRVNFINRVNSDPDLDDESKALLKSQYNNGITDMYLQVGAIGDYAIPCAQVECTTDYIKIGLRYDSVVCYYMAKFDMTYKKMLEEVEKDDSVKVDEFGTYNKLNSGTSVFNVAYDDNRNLATYILDECKGILKNNTALTDEQIEQIIPSEFLYRYGTTSSRLHSNADNATENGGIYFHEWTFSTQTDEQGKTEVETKTVDTWTTHANKNIWYVFALSGGLILVGVLFIVDYFKNKKNENNDIEVIHEKQD